MPARDGRPEGAPRQPVSRQQCFRIPRRAQSSTPGSIQPVSGRNLYTEFLETHGVGVHHMAWVPDDYEATLLEAEHRGMSVVQQGRVEGAGMEFSYLDAGPLGGYVELMKLSPEIDLGDVLGGVDVAVGASHWEVMGSAAVHARLTARFADLVSGALGEGIPEVVELWTAANPQAVRRFTALMSSVSRSGALDTARLCTVDAELELLVRGASGFASVHAAERSATLPGE